MGRQVDLLIGVMLFGLLLMGLLYMLVTLEEHGLAPHEAPYGEPWLDKDMSPEGR